MEIWKCWAATYHLTNNNSCYYDRGVQLEKKQVLAQGLVARKKLLAQDCQLLAQALSYILAYKYVAPISWKYFLKANFGEFIDVTPKSQYQF